MTDPFQVEAPARRQPFINAPLLVILMSAALAVLYAAYTFASPGEQGEITYNYALAPQRFWAQAGSVDVYPDAFSGLLTLLSSALLHADWMHVLVNALMLLALGTPVARALGDDIRGAGLWMLLFVGSVLAGSAFYLALANADSPYLVGASGGTSGMFAAVFVLNPRGGKVALWSRQFLGMTVAFAVANLFLVLVGPAAFGAQVSWEAHAGGYVGGALLMAILPLRGYRRAKP